MQTLFIKKTLAVWAVLAIIFYAFGVRQANAVVVFQFVATCDTCDPLLGPTPSDVTGILEVLDGTVTPMGDIFSGDIVSLSFNFETFGLLTFDPGVTGFLGLFEPGPAGSYNITGDAVETLQIIDSLGQFFSVDLASEGGTATWTVVDVGPNAGLGTPISFLILVPEPGNAIMFLLATTGLMMMRRRRERAVTGRR